jgi:protein-L-isoaspartate(D-aspartate) O-methyltransferase
MGRAWRHALARMRGAAYKRAPFRRRMREEGGAAWPPGDRRKAAGASRGRVGMDYADARRRMVDGQLRPSRVTDPLVLEAMRTLPRERFLPPALRSRAYVDEDVVLPGGRCLMEPLVLARLVQLAAVRPDDRALVVCAGTGYGAAVLAFLGARVTALEPDEALRAVAREALSGLDLPGGLVVRDGVPREGFAAGAPYDVILIEGEVPAVPDTLSAQLAEGGRLAAVEGAGVRTGRTVLGRRIGGSVSVLPVFDCATFPLPDFAPAPGFVF